MSIASEITSIGENLKKDYQAIANLGADLTNVDKNIENIAELLDGVYDNLPKTEYQEGTDINLGKTIKGKLDYDNGIVGYGQTEQDSTTGKNLLNYISNLNANTSGLVSAINDDGSITTTGKPTSDYVALINYDITNLLENGETYYISQKTLQANLLFLQVNIKDNATSQTTLCSLNNSTSNSFVADTTNKTYKVKLQTDTMANWGANNRNITNFYQLEKGSSATPFEKYTGGQASPNPSYPQAINSVTGNQDVVVRGKNLCDISTKLENALITSSAITSGAYTLLYKKLKKGTYTISSGTNMQLVYCFTDNAPTTSTTGISRVVSDFIKKETFTIAQDCYITYRILFYDGSTLDSNVDLQKINSEVQLETGSDRTSFEPYITPTSYQLSLGDKKLYDECYIVGSPDNWKYVDNYAKKTMRGDDIVILTAGVSVGTNYRHLIQFAEGTDASMAWCNYAKFLKNYTADNVHFYLYTNQLILFVPLTYQELKARADVVPLEVVYPLATPVETPITDTTLIEQLNNWYYGQSLDGTTIIEGNGDLPMIIKVRGLKGE